MGGDKRRMKTDLWQEESNGYCFHLDKNTLSKGCLALPYLRWFLGGSVIILSPALPPWSWKISAICYTLEKERYKKMEIFSEEAYNPHFQKDYQRYQSSSLVKFLRTRLCLAWKFRIGAGSGILLSSGILFLIPLQKIACMGQQPRRKFTVVNEIGSENRSLYNLISKHCILMIFITYI